MRTCEAGAGSRETGQPDPPGCLPFASGIIPSHFSHLCPRIRLQPSAWGPGLGWPWGPHGSVTNFGGIRQLPLPGLRTPVSPRQGERGVLALEVLAHQGLHAAPSAFWSQELGRALLGARGQVWGQTWAGWLGWGCLGQVGHCRALGLC